MSKNRSKNIAVDNADDATQSVSIIPMEIVARNSNSESLRFLRGFRAPSLPIFVGSRVRASLAGRSPMSFFANNANLRLH
jgi:hypothetical protein